MKKLIALTLAVLLALSSLTALAEVYKDKPTVKAVQQALNDAGYNCGTPDGSAGKKTRATIESYRADKGLEVTCKIDDDLLNRCCISATPSRHRTNTSTKVPSTTSSRSK